MWPGEGSRESAMTPSLLEKSFLKLEMPPPAVQCAVAAEVASACLGAAAP